MRRTSPRRSSCLRLNEVASDFRVSGVACKWRLHNLGVLTEPDLTEIEDRRLATIEHSTESLPEVPRFSKPFIDRVVVALDAGHLSVRRTASLLDLSLPDLAGLIRNYGYETYFEA